ncbi:MAG: hypothetical protein LBT76_00235 [Tannerella sp.]|nr:hypothetical protein [Tannerella sp.]
MNEENDYLYDDDDAVKFIRNCLPQELKEKFSDDDIVYVTDLLCEYYESKGLLDGDDNEVVDIDEDEILQYVMKNVKRDGAGHFTADELTFIVQGELAYCESIHLFE